MNLSVQKYENGMGLKVYNIAFSPFHSYQALVYVTMCVDVYGENSEISITI